MTGFIIQTDRFERNIYIYDSFDENLITTTDVYKNPVVKLAVKKCSDVIKN